MTNIKTAISIQQSLFNQADTLAHKLRISRSQLFGLAVEEFIRRYQNQLLLDNINKAYTDESDKVEQIHLQQMRKQHRRIVEGEW